MTVVTAKVYLGDGVYATTDVRGVVLTAENGLEVTDTIVLDEASWERLVAYVRAVVEYEHGEGR
jgi:hypothetical protein